MKYLIGMTLIMAIIILQTTKCAAQQYTSLEYTIAVPMNDLRNYIDQTSYRGGTFEFHSKINTKIATGFAIGYNLFYERKPYDTYFDGTAALSGIQYRYTNSIPIHLSGVYFLKEENRFNPFAGLGIGTTYTLRDTDMGLYRWEEDTWSFSVRPEVGFLYTLRESTAVKVALRYNAAFKTAELKDQSYFSISVGFVFINYR